MTKPSAVAVGSFSSTSGNSVVLAGVAGVTGGVVAAGAAATGAAGVGAGVAAFSEQPTTRATPVRGTI